MNFVVLGEGAARVSPALKAAHPELASYVRDMGLISVDNPPRFSNPLYE